MLSQQQVSTKQYNATYAKITDVFEHLKEVVDQLDARKPAASDLLNARDLFPLADRFVHNISASNDAILDSYIDFITNGANSGRDHVREIEREGIRIFKEVKDIALEAQKIRPHHQNGEVVRVDQPYYAELDEVKVAPDKHAFYNNLRTKRGPIQTALFAEARRLGPQYGSNFLLAVEDTFLASIDMLRSMKDVGLNVDMNTFPGREARFENYGFKPPEEHTALLASVDAPDAELAPVDPIIRQSAMAMGKTNKN